MTHSYDDPADARPRGRTERWLIRAFSATLAVATVVSLVHLVGQYRQAGPYRATQAAERAARAAQRALERQPPVATPAAEASSSIPLTVPVSPTGDPSYDDAPPDTEQRGVSSERGSREPSWGPLRWSVPPAWPSVGDDAYPSGVTRMSVRFRCNVSRGGTLSSCSATEEPAGTGLAARTRPALAGARMEPLTANGRTVEGTVTLGVSYTATPRWVRPPQPPAEAEKPPVYMPPSALPPTDRLETPAPPPPEPAPAG